MRHAVRGLSVLLVVLAGCGGGASRESFVEHANAQCRQINERFKTIPAPTGAADTVAYLERSLVVSEAGAGGLRSVAAPPSLQVSYNQLLASIDAANAGLRDALAAARRKDDKALAAAGKAIGDAQTRFKDLASQLGLLTCVTAGAEP